ncbi:hypothetical protein QZM43_09750 [Burkholderia orbicola]|uniref:hypothetical protein n=1 Tax=Burkholderia orbicola TaxID=2978683 RepID=UPI002650DF3F|nr:hypothetical protein [Burkholderia orbicola]ELW9447687.1 hypothetical protein [Burkholderia cenocepacia]MDN7467418.1 hypothetical protein [Burkholderia orbicola]MDN7503008.1 hypothetical protein [Burkholderia orbicola]
MIRNPQQIKLMAIGLPCVPANSGGESSSASNTTTTNADQRNNVGSGVGATASSGGTVTLNVSQLDGGAIAAAFGLGHEALADSAQVGTASMSAVSHSAELAINGILTDAAGTRAAYADAADAAIAAAKSASQQVATAYGDANSAISTAYQDTKTSNVRTLMIGALIVAALAVSMPLIVKEV